MSRAVLHGPAQHLHDVRATRLTVRDLVDEALASVAQRPLRTILTALGGILGIGAIVVVLGLTATTSGQISDTFTIWDATQVRVTDAGITDGVDAAMSFPPDADDRIEALPGVQAAGVAWTIPYSGGEQFPASTTLDPRGHVERVTVTAATPGYLQAIGATLSSGRGLDPFERDLRVAVLGSAVAKRLGIERLDRQPTVFLDGVGYSVVGILSNVHHDSGVLASVIIPDRTALNRYGPPTSFSPAHMEIATRLGAAEQVSKEAPVALRPDQPRLLRVEPIPTPPLVAGVISQTLSALFLVLAGITLFIGAAGIANTTLVSVMERTPEIGLRRTLGARRRDIASQFLAESALVGALGGLVGTALGNGIVLATAIAESWTALLNPWVTIAAPVLGAVVGVAAGLYPALRAASIEPAAAVRR